MRTTNELFNCNRSHFGRVAATLLAAVILLFASSLNARADAQADYERGLATIKDGKYYRVFTEVSGKKYYLTYNGYLSTNTKNASRFQFLKVAGTENEREYEYGFNLRNGMTYFTNPRKANDAAMTEGHLNTTDKYARDTWEAQVFLLNEQRRFAVRATNAKSGDSSWNLYGNTYWTVNMGDNGPMAEYSFDKSYVWQIEDYDPATENIWTQKVFENDVIKLGAIGSTGQQAFNTGYVHKANTRVVLDCNVANSQKSRFQALLGARLKNSNYHAFCFFSRFDSKDVPCFNRSGNEMQGTGDFVYGDRILLTCEGQTASWCRYSAPSTIVGSVTTTGTADDGLTSMLLFNLNTATNEEGVSIDTSPAVMTVYGCKIYEGGTLVCDFIPAYYRGTVGLYDRINQTFSGSLTDTPFQALDGPETDRANYERALPTIKDGHPYRIFTVINGQKYYVDYWGYLYEENDWHSSKTPFTFTKVAGEEYEYGFTIKNERYEFYFMGTGAEQLMDGRYLRPITESSIESSDHPVTLYSQVLFLNENGYYAIRTSNYACGEHNDRVFSSTYWSAHMVNGEPWASYTYYKDYIWQLEEYFEPNYEKALPNIRDGEKFRIYTHKRNDYYDYVKYYLNGDGTLTESKENASSYLFQKAEGDWGTGFMLNNDGTYFTGPGGTTQDALTQGRINTTSNAGTLSMQVFYIDQYGHYAIRSTNADSDENGDKTNVNTYWTVNTGDNGTVAEYSYDKDYRWNIEFVSSDEEGDYERAQATLKDGHYYRIVAPASNGSKYFCNNTGHQLSQIDYEGKTFLFKKVPGGKYDYGFMLIDELNDGCITFNGGAWYQSLSLIPLSSDPSMGQVFFLNKYGRYAIRSSNIDTGSNSEQSAASSYWTFDPPVLEYYFVHSSSEYGNLYLGTAPDYSWLVEESEAHFDYANALPTIREDAYYRIWTEVNGKKYYLDNDGTLTTNKSDVLSYKFLKAEGSDHAGNAFKYGFMLQNGDTYFTRPNGTSDDDLRHGRLNTTTTTSASPTMEAQVFFLSSENGCYAIRATNAARHRSFDEWDEDLGEDDESLSRNTFWTINTSADGPVAEYSVDMSYVWHLEEDAKSIRQYTENTSTYTAGTTFPKFQFKLENSTGWTSVSDDIAVNYTHANGTKWTEHYQLSKLKNRQDDDADIKTYDLAFSFTDEHPDATVEQIGHTLVTAEVNLTMRDQDGQTQQVLCRSFLKPQWKPISFSDYSKSEAYYNDYLVPTMTAEVMNIPRSNYTLWYYLEDNLTNDKTYQYHDRGVYNSGSNDIPGWLEIEDSGVGPYVNAKITVHPRDYLDSVTVRLTVTVIRRGEEEIRDEAVVGEKTFKSAHTYGHLICSERWGYPQDEAVLDNSAYKEYYIGEAKDRGWRGYSRDYYEETGYHGPIDSNLEFFSIYDDIFDGADITLSCEGREIQKLTKFKGVFAFLPPFDEKEYDLEVFLPGYGKRYTRKIISHPYSGLYRISLHSDKAKYWDTNHLSYYRDGKEWPIEIYKPDFDGFLYTEEPVDLFVWRSSNENLVARIPSTDWLRPLTIDIKPELKVIRQFYSKDSYDEWDEKDYEDVIREIRNYCPWGADWDTPTPRIMINWDEIGKNSTIVSVVNTKGEPVKNAKLNYACVDNTMANKGSSGTTSSYMGSFDGYYIDTDPEQYAELIEVNAPGYQPMLATMYLWNYNYFSRENQGKTRRHTIVLTESDAKVSTASLETLDRVGYARNNQVTAKLGSANLLAMSSQETLDYTENADYDKLTKYVDDEKFGKDGWSGLRYAHIVGSLPYEGTIDPAQLHFIGSGKDLQPASTTLITKADFPNFSSNHCLFDFDLSGKVSKGGRVKAVLMNGEETIVDLPRLHNTNIDLIALAKANRIDLTLEQVNACDFDDDAKANGVDMKDMNKAFDKFNLSTPPILPFTLNVQREGDHFLVRGICAYSFLPECEETDFANKAENVDWFNATYQECMTASKKAKDMGDSFFDTNKYISNGFVGLKGYLSGLGYLDEETGKLKVTLYDGGLVYEVSGHVVANLSFGVGSFGVALDGKLAVLLGFMNRQATYSWGDPSAKPEIDIIIDAQFGIKVTAWAEGGLDFLIAKAVGGVRGAGSIDSDTRFILPTYEDNALWSSMVGTKTTLRVGFEAYAEARFLWWTWRKSKTLLDVKKDYFRPNDLTNPFVNPYYNETIFSSRNVTKIYKKLKRKAIADLGTPIISNISGMARPNYMLGGQSLLFNNLKSAADYNDDRLQVYDKGSKKDLVDTGINAPMYDFSEAHSDKLELVVFEQAGEAIDKVGLETMNEEDQTKKVSETMQIHAAIRKNGGAWTTQKVSEDLLNMACVTPAVAVADEKAAVIWQQGKAQFNDDGLRYIDGSLMLSRYDGSTWSEPMEIKRLNRRSVPAGYQLSLKDDSVLVMMTLQQDVNNANKQATVVYVSVSPDSKVHERYTQMAGVQPQMVSVNGANLVGFLKKNEEGRDVTFSTVNMKGEPTGKLDGSLGMEKRMVNDFRLVVDDEAADLDGVSLLWSQSDQEQTDNENGTKTVNIKNRIYTSKLGSHNKQLFFSAPIEVATMPDDVTLVSMDGYMDGLDMKVAYCVSNENDGAAVLEKNDVAFNNDFDYKVNYNPYEVVDERLIPVTITVTNNGFRPIDQVTVAMGDTTYTHDVLVMPQRSVSFTDKYPVTDSFNGTIDYDVTANYTASNSNSLKIRRAAAARPHRIQQSGTHENVRQLDMAVKILNKSIDANGMTTILAEVSNASLLPLPADMTCKVGLYRTTIGTMPAEGTTEVTLNASDLYDAANKKNKVKIVCLTANQPTFSQTLFLHTTPMEGSEMLTDVQPSNNVLPVRQAGKFLKGDVNSDGKVDHADVNATILHISGKTPAVFNKNAADVNQDGNIDVADVIGITKITGAL